MSDLAEELYRSLLDGAGEDADGAAPADGGAAAPSETELYFHGIARARVVLRRVFRLVDQQAKDAGLDPLEHQALIQAFGARDLLRINELAARLDIGNGLSSRLVSRLVDKGLVERVAVASDRRITLVRVTEHGRGLLVHIDQQVQREVAALQEDFTPLDRAAALSIFAFYVGITPTMEDLRRLEGRFIG